MIVSAALCPAAPLLVRDLTGAEEVATDLREACLAAVAELTAGTPDVVAVVGAGERTGAWNDAAGMDLDRYAPGRVLANGHRPADMRRSSGESSAGFPGLPSTLGVGAWLLGQVGWYEGEAARLRDWAAVQEADLRGWAERLEAELREVWEDRARVYAILEGRESDA